MDSIHVEDGKLVFPANSMKEYAHVIIPVYMRALKHWLIQIVSLPALSKTPSPTPNGRDFMLVLYDLLGVESNIDLLRTKWKTFTLPLLQAWHARDNENEKTGDPDGEHTDPSKQCSPG